MTQRPNGRGPLPAKDVVNLGDLLPQEQCVKALKTPAVPEENLPDWAQCAPESAPNSATRLTIDEAQARRHLWMLNLDPRVTNIRAIGHKGMNPRKAINGVFSDDIHLAERWHRQGCGLYLQVNSGGTKKAQVTECNAVFLEYDDRPVLEQVGIWDDLGLPHPTFQVDTGGRSIHHCWTFKTPIEPARWEQLMARLHLLAVGCDTSCKGLPRMMRMAGAWYIDGNGTPIGKSEICGDCCDRYPAELFEDLLPPLHKPCKTRASLAVLSNERPAGARARSGNCTLSVRQIAEALDHIPRRVAGQGTYGTYLRILWGLKAAITEAGGDEELAIRLMEAHSPSEVSGWDVAQVARSGGEHIGPGTFFHHAKQYGWSRHAQR